MESEEGTVEGRRAVGAVSVARVCASPRVSVASVLLELLSLCASMECGFDFGEVGDAGVLLLLDGGLRRGERGCGGFHLRPLRLHPRLVEGGIHLSDALKHDGGSERAEDEHNRTSHSAGTHTGRRCTLGGHCVLLMTQMRVRLRMYRCTSSYRDGREMSRG